MNRYYILLSPHYFDAFLEKFGPEKIKFSNDFLENAGGRFISFEKTPGIQNYTIICEAPRDEIILKYVLGVGEQSKLQTNTIKELLYIQKEKDFPLSTQFSHFIPLGEAASPLRSTEDVMWTVKFRNGAVKRFKIPNRTISEFEKKDASEIKIKAYFPKGVINRCWYKLLTYFYLFQAQLFVNQDSKKRLGSELEGSISFCASVTHQIKRGAEITVVPTLPGFIINPQQVTFRWLEDWHCCEFRICVTKNLEKTVVPDSCRIGFYLGPILIGEVKIEIRVSDEITAQVSDILVENKKSNLYQKIFVSYSRKDSKIVNWLESAYKAIGNDYLRDIHFLRPGQKWEEEILEKITEAEIFQLCWSKSSSLSNNVEKEWRRALSLNRDGFIRPIYWEASRPDPPKELSKYHFAQLILCGD